ncbi:MAG: hypothetical protein EHM68_06740 [Lysobacterales bacterium]|nr:MAG: hypothetical protein EHM68_06740 [Xanthomonadales bacterium]
MATTLIIVNDAPYGIERSYNALRLGGSIAKREGERVQVFLMGDAALCAKRGQSVPNGYYKVENMLRAILLQKGEIGVCGTCMDARGMAEDELVPGTLRGTLNGLTDWTCAADRVLVF